jgi:chromosome segregation ATPase
VARNRGAVYRAETLNATEHKHMKPNKLMLALCSAAVFAAGCNQEKTTAQKLDQAQAKAEEAAQDMKDYTYAQKAEFTAKMQAQLAELNKDLDQLAARIEKSNDKFKAEAKPKLHALRDQEAKLKKHLEEVQTATESTWESVKAGSKKAYADLKDGFNEARQWVSDKIAP